MSRVPPPLPLFALLFAPLATGACGDAPAGERGPARSEGPRPDLPPGTAVAVGAEAILAEEIDRVADALEELDPSRTRIARRRQALTGLLLARAALRNAFPEERAEALARAREKRAELLGTGTGEGGDAAGPPAPGSIEVAGVAELGLAAWTELLGAEPGAWSEPIEGVGRFTLARRLPYNGPRGVLRVERFLFPFELPGDEPIPLQPVLAEQRLSIVDPAWADAVPAQWRYLMRGERP